MARRVLWLCGLFGAPAQAAKMRADGTDVSNLLIEVVTMPKNIPAQKSWLDTFYENTRVNWIVDTFHPVCPDCHGFWPGKTKDELKMVSAVEHCIATMVENGNDPENEELEWCLVGDDDTYFALKNVVPFLKQYDSSQPHYLGWHPYRNHVLGIPNEKRNRMCSITNTTVQVLKQKIARAGVDFDAATYLDKAQSKEGYLDSMFAYGGKGYFLSKGFLKQFGREGIEGCKRHTWCHNMDVRIGWCLYNNGKAGGIELTNLCCSTDLLTTKLTYHKQKMEDMWVKEQSDTLPVSWFRDKKQYCPYNYWVDVLLTGSLPSLDGIPSADRLVKRLMDRFALRHGLGTGLFSSADSVLTGEKPKNWANPCTRTIILTKSVEDQAIAETFHAAATGAYISQSLKFRKYYTIHMMFDPVERIQWLLAYWRLTEEGRRELLGMWKKEKGGSASDQTIMFDTLLEKLVTNEELWSKFLTLNPWVLKPYASLLRKLFPPKLDFRVLNFDISRLILVDPERVDESLLMIQETLRWGEADIAYLRSQVDTNGVLARKAYEKAGVSLSPSGLDKLKSKLQTVYMDYKIFQVAFQDRLRRAQLVNTQWDDTGNARAAKFVESLHRANAKAEKKCASVGSKLDENPLKAMETIQVTAQVNEPWTDTDCLLTNADGVQMTNLLLLRAHECNSLAPAGKPVPEGSSKRKNRKKGKRRAP